MLVGVLVPELAPGSPPPPATLPFGRAALRLADEGITVVFGGRAADGHLIGVQATSDGWTSERPWRVCAALDRFPGRSRPLERAALAAGLEGVPIANPPSLVALCADKVATQRLLRAANVPMPELEEFPDRFRSALEGWGAGFLKPRFGAFGRGIRRVVPGDPLPPTVDGAVPGRHEPSFLQRAVAPPPGWAGVSARVLVQRRPEGGWHTDPPVARCSRTDPVVNAARGAEVRLLATLVSEAVADHAVGVARRCAEILGEQPGGDLFLEGGVDVVIDAANEPWVLEVNGTPRGRLDALRRIDVSFDDSHVESCARPLRVLASRFG